MNTRTLLALAAVTALAGCTVEENSRITVGQDVHLEAFEPEAAGTGSIVPPLDTGVLARADVGFVEEDEIPGREVILLAPPPEPSIATFDRSAWPKVRFFVPVDHTFHRPLYTLDLDYLPRGDRDPGAYPTALSAVTVPSGGIGGQVAETIATPFVAAANSLLIVPWLFVDAPWSLDFSPQEPYDRYWLDAPTAPVFLPVDEPGAAEVPPAAEPGTETEPR